MSIHRNIGIEDVDPSKHRDRRCRSIETSGSKMSIHRDRKGLVQSKVIVISPDERSGGVEANQSRAGRLSLTRQGATQASDPR
jgi:hypothetical protein